MFSAIIASSKHFFLIENDAWTRPNDVVVNKVYSPNEFELLFFSYPTYALQLRTFKILRIYFYLFYSITIFKVFHYEYYPLPEVRNFRIKALNSLGWFCCRATITFRTCFWTHFVHGWIQRPLNISGATPEKCNKYGNNKVLH